MNETITGKGMPMMINEKSISFCPWNPRPEITDEDVAELAASIRDNGLLNRLSVIKAEDGYIVFAGNRRLAACRLAGLHDVPCELFDITEREARVLTALENLQRKDVEPIREAALVEECLAAGLSGEEIAAKIGKSNAWVTRRRKLLALPPKTREAAERHPLNITADALENIAIRPEGALQRDKDIAARIATTATRIDWNDIRYMFEGLEHSLDAAVWIKKPTKTANEKVCASCVNRTGAQADLFGACDSSQLGKCLHHKCFQRMTKAWKEEIVAKVVPEGTEIVMIERSWMMPNGAKDKKSKKYPCAYVCVDSFSGEVKVKWWLSKKEFDEAEQRRLEERENAERQNRERGKRMDRIIEDYIRPFDDDEKCAKLLGGYFASCAPKALKTRMSELLRDWISDIYGELDVCRLIEAFPEVRAVIPKEDLAWIEAQFGHDDEGEEE